MSQGQEEGEGEGDQGGERGDEKERGMMEAQHVKASHVKGEKRRLPW